MTFFIILALSVFMISLLGTRLVLLALRKRHVLMDRPNERSNHKIPTPRGGGIAVVFALIIGLLIDDVNYAVILSLLILAAISLIDDLVHVPPPVRLLVQALAVALTLCTLHDPLFGGLLPVWLDKVVTALLWLWFINLFNFMDGIDGIAATEMICIGMGICLVASLTGHFSSEISTYGLIVAAAGCGFLWWNWHPARIFLGDVGSIPIGFLLGYLLLLAAQSGYEYPAMILPAYYLSDATITLGKRLWKRQRIWVAHSSHYYQKAVRGGRKHDIVSRYIFGINLLLILLATLSVIQPEIAIFHLAIAYMAVFMLLGFFAHEKHHEKK